MTVMTDVKPDFSGYATKNGLKCSDGRMIMGDAFKHQDQVKVPLVWQHSHNEPTHILGYAILEHREDGVYTYAFFNDTPQGANARELVKHGDITALSIYANNLKQQGANVIHGNIKEVSLVLSGANPGAFIDNINLQHSDSDDTLVGEVVIYTGEEFTLEHANTQGDTMSTATTDNGTETVQDVYDTLTDKQKSLVDALLYDALNSATDTNGAVKHSDEAGTEVDKNDDVNTDTDTDTDSDTDESKDATNTDADTDSGSTDADADADADTNNDADIQHNNQEGLDMSRNVFEQNETATKKNVLSHSDLAQITTNAQKVGSYKEAFNDFLEHATYGIEDIEYMFPDARAASTSPELIARQAEWVPLVLDATKHSPFARIKSVAADLTADEARAKGYIKGTEKKDEVVKLLRRTTGPTTVYKKQKLDRDDIIDITDLDVVVWLKWEIRFMLNEELARAILVGDGRDASNPDKIKDPEGAVDGIGIRSIVHDNELYAHQVELAANVSSTDLIDGITRARTEYRGSGGPTFYTTDSVLTDMLLLKDKMGRRVYGTEAELASALRAKDIVSVPVLEETADVLGILVNLVDYTIGANKGGELTFFEDFDIDFNQNKYLLETRVSGALTKPKSAIVIRRQLGTMATVTGPSFNGATNTITIPTSTGVDYLIDGTVVTGDQVITSDTTVTAAPQSGYYIPANTTTSWTYVYTP